MDRVRFGRALGYGARHAAKAVLQAVEAAAAPTPEGPQTAGRPPGSPVGRGAAPSTLEEMARTAAETHRSVQQAQLQMRGTATRAAKVAGKSVFTPLARFSGVLWLEVTGTFFALIALFVGQGAWRLRDGFRLPPTAHDAQKLYFHTGIFLLFTYFAVSSFVRARRRERR